MPHIKWWADDNTKLQKAHISDAGYDIILGTGVTVVSGMSTLKLNLRIQIQGGYYALLKPRSSTFKKGLILIDGVIDAGYCGYLNLQLLNLNKDIEIPAGSAIAQLIFLPVIEPYFEHTNEFTLTQRGNNGLGSTIK